MTGPRRCVAYNALPVPRWNLCPAFGDCMDQVDDAGWSSWTCATCDQYRAARVRGELGVHGGHYLDPPPDVAPPAPLLGDRQTNTQKVQRALSWVRGRGIEEIAARAGLTLRQTQNALGCLLRAQQAWSNGCGVWRRRLGQPQQHVAGGAA